MENSHRPQRPTRAMSSRERERVRVRVRTRVRFRLSNPRINEALNCRPITSKTPKTVIMLSARFIVCWHCQFYVDIVDAGWRI